MPGRSTLSASDRATLLALPTEEADRIRVHSFSETDLALVRQRRGDANRFGFAVQLCLLRYPGVALSADRAVDDSTDQGHRTSVPVPCRAPQGARLHRTPNPA